MRGLVLVALLAGACQKGDGVVVVTLTTHGGTLGGIASLHARATVGGKTSSFVVPTGGGTFSLPPARTFAVAVPYALKGGFAIYVEALDAHGATLASADGNATVVAGSRADVSLAFPVAASGDGGDDMAAADMADVDAGVVTCAAGMHVCSGACVSDTSVESCGPGSCTPCPVPTGGTATCDGTQCGGSCPSGKKLCAGACIDDGQACSGVCPSGTHDCGGVCAPDDSVNSCGAMCTGCPAAPTHGKEVCDGSPYTCDFMCGNGFHRCSSACADDTMTATCGSRCTPCPTDPNGTATCDGMKCGLSCKNGYVLSGDSCVPCGAAGNLCCTGKTCNTGLSCYPDGDCHVRWTVVSVNDNPAGFNSVWGSGSTDVYVVDQTNGIYHSNGSAFSLTYPAKGLMAVGGSASNDVYVVGDNQGGQAPYGFALRSTAGPSGPWQTVTVAGNGDSRFLWDVWAADATHIFLCGENFNLGPLIEESPGSASPFVTQTLPSYSSYLVRVWASSATDVWSAGLSGLLHYTSSAGWQAVTPPGLGGYPMDVRGSGPNDVYTCSQNATVAHWNGSNWTEVTVPAAAQGFFLKAIWAVSPTDVYVGGSGGIIHFDGSQWDVEQMPTGINNPNFVAAWGSGTNDIYFVGNAGSTPVIIHHP